MKRNKLLTCVSFSALLGLSVMMPAPAAAAQMTPVKGTGCQAMGESFSVAAARKIAKDKAVKNAIESAMVSSQSLFVDVSGADAKEEYQSIMRIVETTVAGRIIDPRFSDFYEKPKDTHCIDVAGKVDMDELRDLVNSLQGVDPVFENQLRAKTGEYAKAKEPKNAAEADARKAALMEFLLKKPVVQTAYGETPGSDNKTPKQSKAEAEDKALTLARKVALNRLVARLGDLPPDVLAVPLPQARNMLDAGLKLANKAYMDQGGKPVAEPVWEGGMAIAIVKATYAYQGEAKAFIAAGGAITSKGGAPKGAAAGASMVMMTLNVNGVIPPDVRKLLAKGVEKELGKHYQIFSGKKVEAAENKAVENYKVNDCHDDDHCVADVANAIGASYAAIATVMKARGNYVLGLRIYDVAKDDDLFDDEVQCPGCSDADAAGAFETLAAKCAAPAQ